MLIDSITINALRKRYKDAYLVAGVTVGIGQTVKGFGISLFVIIACAAFFANQSTSSPSPMTTLLLLGGVLIATVVGGIAYVLGILVAAQGQSLRASLDCAVNSSPFLDNAHKAEIMSLPFQSTPAPSAASVSASAPVPAAQPLPAVAPTAVWKCRCSHSNPAGTVTCQKCKRSVDAII